MGKRKYEDEQADLAKKAKKGITIETDNEVSEQPINDAGTGDEEKHQNPRGFDVKYFRKELSGKQGQTTVLTQFLQVCLNPDNDVDYLLEYLKCGGNSHEILRQITSDNKKNLTIATPAFHLFYLIIMKVQSSLPHMITITEEACRYFLNTFMSTVEIMISDSAGPRHRKIVLKLLTSIVTLNSDLGIEVLNQAPLAPKQLQHIVEKPNYKEKDNVRTCFVHFMTSFLVEGHLPLIKALLEKQGLLGLVIPGLIHDEVEAVLMFLNILKKNVIDNALISKSLKLKTFSQQVMHNMFKMFSWKGPPDTSHANKNESRQEIVSLLSEIIVTLFTNHKVGLYFNDSSLGMTDANKNPSLFKALLSLKRPWENDTECNVILEIVYKCPDLHRAIINVIEQSFEPQHSPIWERTTEFTVKLLDKLKPEKMIPKMSNLPPPQIANFVRFLTLPVPLLKYIQTNLGKDQTISLYCIKVLVKMLQTLRRYMQILETNDSAVPLSDLKNRLEYFLPKHLPTPAVLVATIDTVIAGKENPDSSKDYTLPKINTTDALISLLDLLLLYNDIHPTFFETLEGTIDMKKVLDFSITMSDDHVSILKFKVVSLWLTLDSSAISLKNPVFKDLFLIMLDVYISDDDNTCIEAKDTLNSFFKNTGIFEADEDEVHLILYTLRNTKVKPDLIGDIVEYVLDNIKDLSEYVRSQLVNFEIADENSASALEKMFDDLMENRNTEDNLFLENKVPSPFIVGCIQYMQMNKDVKKNLKPFVSLYIVNLLHTNYSPELTEVLMGDCKLEAREYVATWRSEAVITNILSQNELLINISESIINSKDFLLTDIFPFLVESTDEDKDVILNNIAYKIDVTRHLDSSELLIWAKYLVFCTVRLTDMDRMTHDRQKKIRDYFQCIVAIGRKYHKVNICRTILLSMLKNPHVLKIYKPLDLNKGDVTLLATKFLLEVMNDHKDIISYLNRKHKVLKSYKQKNYIEIEKAFVKLNKRKNVNAEHTISVLETVGLADEDDMRVFNLIFAAEPSNCVKDDKEPSLVLELLKYLIDKYSNSVNLELQPQIIRKCTILYTGLLTNKEINANLTNLEGSLARYFENKPHQVNKVSDDLFKKFFEANTIRKTTSYLAAVLLENNIRFCNAFKEQIIKPDILSHRELALPLGTAIINHKAFVLENRKLLGAYYNEYKANINKMLEKPHKAGQVYVTNFKFIRKLILECMDIGECGKFFSKSYKFESVESTHVNLVHTIFLKLCTSDSAKVDHLVNYLLSMLHLATVAGKEGKDANVLDEIVTNIYRAAQISELGEAFDVGQKDAFEKVTGSAPWQSFCKAALKDSLRVRTAAREVTAGPQLLGLLTRLVKLLYPPDHDDVAALFDMATSHSEFLNVMLSHRSPEIKTRLVEFLYAAVRLNGAVMRPRQIPTYLSAYRATRRPGDRLILAILHHYETNGVPVNEYKPYVWGDSGAAHYAVRESRPASLWARPTANRVLGLFDRETVERTAANFPGTQKLEYHYELPLDIDGAPLTARAVLDRASAAGAPKAGAAKDTEGAVRALEARARDGAGRGRLQGADVVNSSHSAEDEAVYDPLFVLPLLSHALAEGGGASPRAALRGGALAVPLAALAAACPRLRAAAYHVLHRFCMLLDTETRHKNDKLLLNDFIVTLRRSIGAAWGAVEVPPRLAAVSALYLARGMAVVAAPFDPLYRPVNDFLIARDQLDLTVVPDFLNLFHGGDLEAPERRLWILETIRAGTRTVGDLDVIFKTMCVKMILAFYPSVLGDRRVREKILEVVAALVAVPRAFEILVEGYGLISWLHSVARQMQRPDRVLARGVLNVVTNVLYSMKLGAVSKSLSLKPNDSRTINDFPEVKTNKDMENEILIVLYDSFRSVDGLEAEDLLALLKGYNLISRRTIKMLSKAQVLNIVNMVGTLGECDCVSLLVKALTVNDANIIRSKLVEVMTEKNSLLNELTVLVKRYLVQD